MRAHERVIYFSLLILPFLQHRIAVRDRSGSVHHVLHRSSSEQHEVDEHCLRHDGCCKFTPVAPFSLVDGDLFCGRNSVRALAHCDGHWQLVSPLTAAGEFCGCALSNHHLFELMEVVLYFNFAH